MDNQQHVNRRRRRNLPAELKVEIVDCLPLENAVHFLVNVPNRLIIHHCAPRIRRMLGMIRQIAADYARTLPAPKSRRILLQNGHQYTPEIDIFLRYGAAHSEYFSILRGNNNGFVGFPVDFFDDLIMHYYQTKVPTKGVQRVSIDLNNPAPWPTALVQPQAKEMKVHNHAKWAEYSLRNKHNPGILFEVWIFFQEKVKCYQEMTGFEVNRVYLMDNAQYDDDEAI